MPVVSLYFSPDETYFAGHFPDNPLVPAVVILDRFEHALYAEQGAIVAGWNRSKFIAAVLPNQTVDYQFEILNQKLTLSAKVNDVCVCEAVGSVK